MNEQLVYAALSRMNLKDALIAPHFTGLADNMMRLAASNPTELKEHFEANTRSELCEAYGFTRREQNKPFAFAEGVAIIPIHGTLLNRYGWTSSWATGYNFIRAQHNAALLDPDVKMIVHDHNSYGGEAAGCFELSDDIYNSRSVKPTYAVVDSNCYSASFALASAATKIFVIPSAGVGSIGVVAMHVDMSKLLDKFGIVVTFIHSGAHKVDGNPYETLSDDVKKDIQASVDKSRAKFVAVVARNLGLDSKIVHNTEARTYRAEDALELKLVHAIAVPSAVLQEINEDESDDADESESQLSTQKENKMDNQANTPAAGQPAAAVQPTVDQAAVAKAERERVSGILTCEEAKGRSALANHFALSTSMSVDDAKAALKVAPQEAAATPAPAAAAEPNKLEQAMNNTAQPNVGADAAAANAANGDIPVSARILKNYEQASGVKLDEK